MRLRSEDPSLSGMRIDDVKATIIERQTGRKASSKTIAREERLARRIAEDLSPEWAAEADRGNPSAEAVRAGLSKSEYLLYLVRIPLATGANEGESTAYSSTAGPCSRCRASSQNEATTTTRPCTR